MRHPQHPLRREQLRLRRLFTTIVFALAPAALAEACGLPGTTPRGDAGASAGGGAEAGTGAEAGAGVESGTDAGTDAAADAPLEEDADASPEDAGGGTATCSTLAVLADSGPDAEPLCYYTLTCGLTAGLVAIGCGVYDVGMDDAGPQALGCTLVDAGGCDASDYELADGSSVTLACLGCLGGGGGGRRPRGLRRAPAPRARSALGAYFARMAHDEAASVHAFRRLSDELSVHGAPSALVLGAARSARDEEHHARVMTDHARGHGASVASPRVRRARPRSLEALARENAVEGCVNETFGALILCWQAAHAADASARRTFARLAADETRHAALSWAVAQWAEGRLDAAGRARVAAARARALRDLTRGAREAPFASPVGRPDRRARAALLDALIEGLGIA